MRRSTAAAVKHVPRAAAHPGPRRPGQARGRGRLPATAIVA